MTQTIGLDDMDVYGESLQLVVQLESQRADLYRQQLAAILKMHDHSGFAMVEGAVAGSMRPHSSGTRGDRWVGLDDIAAADLTSELVLSFNQAASLVDVAMQTRTRYANATAALGSGGMTERKLKIINDELTNCKDELARSVVAVVLPYARKDTPARFARRIRTEVMRADGAGAAERRKHAVADRFVSFNPGPDGTGILYAQHDGVVIKAMEDRLVATAGTADPDDPRSRDQRIADSVAAAILGPGAFRSAVDRQTSLVFEAGGTFTVDPQEIARVDVALDEIHQQMEKLNWNVNRIPAATIHVQVPAGILAGADLATAGRYDIGGCATCGRRGVGHGVGDGVGVATIDGLGPIDPELARNLAKDARWLRIITDPITGVAIDAETPAYVFPAAMRHRIQTRDRHCRFPGCTRSASSCEFDHVIPHPVCATSMANALLLCKRHHRLKHHTKWKVQTTPTGEATWTSPTGRSYNTKPPPAD